MKKILRAPTLVAAALFALATAAFADDAPAKNNPKMGPEVTPVAAVQETGFVNLASTTTWTAEPCGNCHAAAKMTWGLSNVPFNFSNQNTSATAALLQPETLNFKPLRSAGTSSYVAVNWSGYNLAMVRATQPWAMKQNTKKGDDSGTAVIQIANTPMTATSLAFNGNRINSSAVRLSPAALDRSGTTAAYDLHRLRGAPVFAVTAALSNNNVGVTQHGRVPSFAATLKNVPRLPATPAERALPEPAG